MCCEEKALEALLKAVESLERSDELTRKRVRSEPINWFKKKEKKEEPT